MEGIGTDLMGLLTFAISRWLTVGGDTYEMVDVQGWVVVCPGFLHFLISHKLQSTVRNAKQGWNQTLV